MPKHIDLFTMNEFFQSNIDGYLPILLEIKNPDIVWEEGYGQDNGYLRLIADENKVTYKGHTWLPCAFDFTPPELDGSKIGTASISISAIDARVRILLRSIRIESEVSVIAAFNKIEKDNSGKFIYKFIPLETTKFIMSSASSNNTIATFNLTYETSLNQNVPFDVATQDRVPAVKND